MLILGFSITTVVWKIYVQQKIKLKEKEKEELENEIIEGLLELKKHTLKSNDKKLSDKYDLLEIAFENNVLDITIANEEGLPVISTLKNPDEDSAQYSALFQKVNKSINSNLLKVSIKSEEGYKTIHSIIKNGIVLYVIFSSNVELDPINERKLIKDILNILDNYIPN